MRLPIVPLLFASAAFANPAFRFSRRDGSVPALDGGHAAMSPNATGEYPRSTNKRSDGSMIGAYTLQTGNEYILKSVKSTDGGATWSPLGEVVGFTRDFVTSMQLTMLVYSFVEPQLRTTSTIRSLSSSRMDAYCTLTGTMTASTPAPKPFSASPYPTAMMVV